VSIKFLANENIPNASIAMLQKAGFDVLAASREFPGASDEMVLSRARKEARVLVTFDRDYGELIFHRLLPVPPAVIYLRFIPENPTETAKVVQEIVNQTEITGYFVAADRESLRRRRLPK
jgi:predicted nuclease of predicted toxin-antitoxin system